MKTTFPPWRAPVLFALLLMSSQVWAVQVSFPANFPALRGTAIDIPVTVDNTTGLNIYSVELQFTFNTAALTVVDVLESGTLLAPWTSNEYHEVTGNSLRIVASGATPLSGSGTLLNVHFNLPLGGTGNANLTWTTASCRLNEGSPTLTFVNGFITITDPPVISLNPSTAEIFVGDSIFASANGGTAPYTFSALDPLIGTFHSTGTYYGYFVGLSYGTTKLQATDFNSVSGTSGSYVVRPIKLVIPDSTILSGQTFLLPVKILLAGGGAVATPQALVASFMDSLGAKHPRLFWQQTAGVSYDLYRRATWFANISDPGVTQILGVTDELPGDPNVFRYTDNAIDLGVDPNMHYAVTAVGAGGGVSVYSGQFRITFNSAVVTLVSIERAGTLTSSFQFSYESHPTYVDVSFSNSTPLAGSGTLFYLQLYVVPGSSYTNMTLSNALFNESLFSTYRQGSVTRIPPPSILISPGTAQETVVGDSIQFSASGGTAPYSWFLTNGSTGTVSSTGRFKALAGGLTYAWVQDANGFTDSSALITVDDFRIIAQSLSGHAGDSVTVNLQLTGNATGLGVFSSELNVSVGSNIFTFAYPILSGTLMNGWSSAFEVTNNSSIKIAASNGVALVGSGTLLQLRGRISPTAPITGQPISLGTITLNEGNRRAYRVNGTLSVIP